MTLYLTAEKCFVRFIRRSVASRSIADSFVRWQILSSTKAEETAQRETGGDRRETRASDTTESPTGAKQRSKSDPSPPFRMGRIALVSRFESKTCLFFYTLVSRPAHAWVWSSGLALSYLPTETHGVSGGCGAPFSSEVLWRLRRRSVLRPRKKLVLTCRKRKSVG